MRIEGKLTNCTSSKVYLEEIDVYLTRAIDSVRLKKNGKFRFSDNSRFPRFYQLRMMEDGTIQLLMEPGEKAIIRADCKDFQNSLEIKGSEGSVLVNEIVFALSKTIDKLDSVNNIYENTTDLTMRDDLVKEYEEIMNDHRKYTIE